MQARTRRRLLLGIGIAALLCLAYAGGFGVYRLWNQSSGALSGGPPEGQVFWEAWDRVDRHFFGEVPSPRSRTYGAIRRSLALLDSYTLIVEPALGEIEQDRLRGSYGGIGVTVWRNSQGQIGLAPYPDSPAERAGLQRADVLLAIDGEPVADDAAESQVQARLRGEMGSRVRLTLRRSGGSPFDVSVERDQIEVPSVTWHRQTASVGYVRLERFTERTADELSEALAELQETTSGGVVLDLRQNRGGLLESAVAVASRFLEEGAVVVHQVGRSDRRSFRAQAGGDPALPLVVLVDGGTASAAEIVAGALQDHERALLMGEPTVGKGSLQEIYALSDGASLYVTAALWLTPDERRIDESGLTPDVVVTATDGPADGPLKQAVAYLGSE